MKKEEERYLSPSLIKGLEILKLFHADRPTLSLAEIADHLQVNRTTPFRLLYTLQQAGYVQQDPATKRYRLTPRVLELGFSYLRALQLPELAQPYLEQLRDETGASAHIGILDGREVVYVARVAAKAVSDVQVTIGARLPAHATAMGKVLLAFLPLEQQQERLLGSDLQPYTQTTKTMLAAFNKELRTVQEQGYAISQDEFEQGISSLAMPIFGQGGQVRAAINVAVPSFFWKEKTWKELYLPVVKKAAKELSLFSGYSYPANE